MYQINVWLRGCPANFTFNYETHEMAMAALENIRSRRKEGGENAHVTVKDDYGHVFDCWYKDIVGVVLTNITDELEMAIDKKILETHANKKLQDYVRTDPILSMVRAPGQMLNA